MHNLIEDCCITFNDLVAARFDSIHLDFWTAFTVPAGKRSGYNNMIGNISDLTEPKTKLPRRWLNLPLPLFYTRDSGVALPTAALPYNDMRIQFKFRHWEKLLVMYDCNTTVSNACGQNYNPRRVENGVLLKDPSIAGSDCQVWANYAIVSNDERKRMACAPRDILIEQVQITGGQTFEQGSAKTHSKTGQSYDVRFSHAIKVLFFGVRNCTIASEWSNYTASTPLLVTNIACDAGSSDGSEDVVDFDGKWMVDPIARTSLVYENTTRLASMGSDYYSLVQPYYHAPSIPLESGYHMYSYSLDFICLDPMGSTNFGKLTNVSLVVDASEVFADPPYDNAHTGKDPVQPTYQDKQRFQFLCTAVNNNIVRISGGALGFPVL